MTAPRGRAMGHRKFPELFFEKNIRLRFWEPSNLLLGTSSFLLGVNGPTGAIVTILAPVLLGLYWWCAPALCFAWDCTDRYDQGTCNGNWGVALTPAADKSEADCFIHWSFIIGYILGVAWLLWIGLLKYRTARTGTGLFMQVHMDAMKHSKDHDVSAAATDENLDAFEEHVLDTRPDTVGRRHLSIEEIELVWCLLSPEAWFFDTPTWGIPWHKHAAHTITRWVFSVLVALLTAALAIPPEFLVGRCPAKGSMARLDHKEECWATWLYMVVVGAVWLLCVAVWTLLYLESLALYRKWTVQKDGQVLTDEFMRYVVSRTKTK